MNYTYIFKSLSKSTHRSGIFVGARGTTNHRTLSALELIENKFPLPALNK